MKLILCLLLAFATTFVSAQTAGTGGLTGTVTDATGAVVPGVVVTAVSADTGQERTSTTNAAGSYTFSLLQPGMYRVRFASKGFKTSEISGIKVNVTETPVLNQALEVGAQTEQVTVEAAVETLQTTNATLGTVVSSQAITELPLNTRNYTNIIALSAGANTGVNNATQLGKGSQDIAVNGAATSQNNFLMDGVSIVNFAGQGTTGEAGSYAGLGVPNPDTLAEFKIQTSLYDAGSGRNPGANVNVVTKSGTNQFHGTGFYFFRNTKLNANDFFVNRSGQDRPILKQNQYGLTIGGPIKKDKLFFFFSFQETGQKNGAASQGFASGVILPSIPNLPRGVTSLAGVDDSAAAAFRQALGASYCTNSAPSLGIKVACNGSNINNVAMRLLQAQLPAGGFLIPASGTGGNVPHPFSVPAIYNEHQFMGNGDYIVNSKHTIGGRYYYQTTPQALEFAAGCGATCLPGSPAKVQFSTTSAILKVTSILTNSLVNEARMSLLRNVTDDRPKSTFTDPQFGITPLVPTIPSLSAISLGGLFRIGGSNFDDQVLYVNQIQWGDQISWSHGRHNIRAGVELERVQWNWTFPSLSKGLLNFNSFPDFLIGRAGCAPADLGSGACSAANPGNTNGSPLSNIVASALATRTSVALIHSYRATDANAYVQDDIKVSSRFTLNLGLRWEFDGLVSEKYGYLTSIFPSAILKVPVPGTSPASGTFAGFTVPANYGDNPNNPALPASVTVRPHNIAPSNSTPLNNFAPRLGFAWQPLGGNRFVVRGGYGLFYNRIPGNQFIQSVQEASPYAGPAGASGAANYYASLSTPFLPGPPGWNSPRWVNFATGQSSNLNPASVQEVFLTPLTYAWNLNMQYEFMPRWVLEVGYVGSHGIHQNSTHVINMARVATPSNPINGVTTTTVANASLRVPYLGFAPAFNQESTDGDYKYNSLQATLRKQMSHGLSFQGAYTFSRAFTNIPRNSNDPEDSRQSYGLNQQYRPHRFVASYTWNIPYGNMKGVGEKVLGGWSLAGVTTVQSGVPFSLFDTRAGTAYGALANTGRVSLAAGFTYADLVNAGNIKDNLNNYLNKAAIGAPPVVGAATGWGTSGASIVQGPGQVNFDAALAKTTRVGGLRENAVLQFRAEFFNIFNHAQFANPGNVFGQGSFGVITATTVNPRLIQLALKYTF